MKKLLTALTLLIFATTAFGQAIDINSRVPYTGATRNVNLGTYSLTGLLRPNAGTATVPPVVLLPGTLTTSGLSGAAEYDSAGTYFYLTPASTVRHTIDWYPTAAATAHTSIFNGQSGNGTSTALNDTATGVTALLSSATDSSNCAYGYQSQYSNRTGISNNSFGVASLSNLTSGADNNAFGVVSLVNLTSGADNDAFGHASLYSNTTGSGNSAFGYQSGYNAGTALQTLSNCSFFGSGSNSSTDGLTNSTALGYGAQVTASNQIVLGNSSVTKLVTPATSFQLGTSTTNGYVLTANSSGVGTWQAASGGGMTNPMTTVGDLIYGGTAGAPTRLADVATGMYLASGGVGVAPAWATLNASAVGLGNVSNAAQVTSLSIATANGFQGSSAGGQTPALTINVDGTHYLPLLTDQTAWNAKQSALTLPGSPVLGHLVGWGASNATLTDAGAVPTLSGLGGLAASGATTGATSQAQAFTNGIIAPTHQPVSDSTTAIQFKNAAGSATVLDVDTTNTRIGIGTTPSYTLDVAGTGFNCTQTVNNTNAIIGNFRNNGTGLGTGAIIDFWVAGTEYGRFACAYPSAAGQQLQFYSSQFTTPDVVIDANGHMGRGVQYPNSAAGLHLAAGTTTVGPLLIPSGTNLTTPVSGMIENNGTNLEYTDSTPTRHKLATGAADADAAQTIVNGSGSGTVIFTQPRFGTSDKVVKCYLNSLVGTASYTFPTAFTHTPQVLSQSLAATASVSTTGVTITGTSQTGFVELSGF